jgi:glutamyl-tRNA synthetase
MLKNGLAYPCFMTNDEQEQMRVQQKKQGVKTGYYGTWAIWRNVKQEEVIAALDSGKPFVIRYRSDGNPNQRIIINDLIRGRLELPEDDNDIVLLKSDGLPTYHFAHVIDDHLMRTTTVIRGDEWLSSLPLHIQLSKVLGFKPFEYGHLSTIQKIDENGSRRKLSKRKDPEASVEYYFSYGYPVEAVKDYLMNIANPGFEMWKKENPNKTYAEYKFSIEKMPSSGGGLLDLTKLNDVSKEFIGEMSADEIVARSIAWSKEFDIQLYEILTGDVKYTKKVFSIERGKSTIKKRKDIAHFSQIKDQYSLFFRKYFEEMVLEKEVIEKISSFNKNDIKNIIDSFIDTYNEADDNAIWFDKVKIISEKLGYTTNLKEYRKHPEKFKGSVIDVANILRAAITKRFQSPDLCDVMKTIGRDESILRLTNFRNEYDRSGT